MICGIMLASICVQVLGCLFISHLYCWNETRSLVGVCYLLRASVYLLLNTHTLPSVRALLIFSPPLPNYESLRLLQLGVPFHFQCSTWCQRRMASEHRNGPEMPICLHDLYQSQTLSCISLATTRSLQMDPNGHSSKEGVLPTVPEAHIVQMMVMMGNSGVIYEEVLHSTVWTSIVQDNEHGLALVQNWTPTDWCDCF